MSNGTRYTTAEFKNLGLQYKWIIPQRTSGEFAGCYYAAYTDSTYIRWTAVHGTQIKTPAVWEEIEPTYTTSSNTYTNGQIINNIKYTYKGIE